MAHDTVLAAGFADPARDAARAFRLCLNAMARPGTLQDVAPIAAPAPLSAAAATVLLTLADSTTPLFIGTSHDTPEVRAWIAFHTGAPLVDRAQAVFAVGSWAALGPTEAFAQGTAEYPDRSTTLIVERSALTPANARLTGPGIQHAHELRLPDPAAFQANAALFPLGVDFYFTAGTQLAALPRTTKVEAL
ncbi:phosphonate C-P lyase system protein PhnH [Donghicola mangrovi]|uniref:Phosphonate C-P lyase system protein PhnH n=1 Tax=Donghicola mangrovi TaxID=2729614 RepID=A0A850Q8P1_9RHOB|nr:phosphonate C-P lyase system protein PhnH [Donghicola mangrovi]NVO25284.1 phosphonate C-P lyase system protein PhnH [Donghicola mangrovi]